MNLFENLGLSLELQKIIGNLGFSEPTQIQALSIPHIMEGRDVIGESATGSGKTLAFGCAIAERVMPNKGLQAVILTPTRELAEQVKDSLKQLCSLNIIAVYGGVSIGPQIDNLRRADVVVATPGRMLDHLNRRTINVSRVGLIVLDEADRMFEMGFIEDVKLIIKACPSKRQTLFFSATISSRVKNLANHYMANPQIVLARKYVDPRKLKQGYYDVPRSMKLSLLVHLLKNEKSGLVMVFCNTRKNTDFVAKNLKANRVNAIPIHGGLPQNKRTKTIELFNKARVSVLVCTDVAARGLHIENVSHIYNYDLPKDANDYVHRIGRTARAGEEGIVVNLLCDVDHDNFSRILHDYDFNIEKLQKPYVNMVMVADRKDFGRRDFPRRSFSGRRQYSRRRY